MLCQINFQIKHHGAAKFIDFFKGITLFPKSIWNAKEQCQDIVTSYMSGEGNLLLCREGRMGNDDRVGPTELGGYVYSVVTWYI